MKASVSQETPSVRNGLDDSGFFVDERPSVPPQDQREGPLERLTRKIAIRDACSTADIFGGCSGGFLVLFTVVLEWSLRTRTQVLELGPRDWIILFSILVCPGLSRSVLVGDFDFSCGRTDEGTLRGPCGPKNGQKTTIFLYIPQVVQSRQDGMNQGFA